MGKCKYYAVNSSGRQLLKSDTLVDAYLEVKNSTYYKQGGYYYIVEEKSTRFYPEDFE